VPAGAGDSALAADNGPLQLSLSTSGIWRRISSLTSDERLTCAATVIWRPSGRASREALLVATEPSWRASRDRCGPREIFLGGCRRNRHGGRRSDQRQEDGQALRRRSATIISPIFAPDRIEEEARLDGVYVIRTMFPPNNSSGASGSSLQGSSRVERASDR